MRILLCHNPDSGTKGYDKDSILAALRLADYDVRYASVKDENFKLALAKFGGQVDLVVAAGGDGTLAEALTNMPDRSVPVAILPLGTANNFARSLGIGGTPQELVETWQINHACPASIGAATGAWGTTLFLESFGVGLFPDFLKKASQHKKLEGADNLRMGRKLLQEALNDAKPLDVMIKLDGKTFEQSILGIEVCNIPFTGPGLPIAAAANASDDKLDVIIFDVDQRNALIEWIDAPLDAKPPVKAKKCKQVQLTWRNAAHRIDDQYFDNRDKEQTINITVEETPVRILIPVKHPAQKAHEKAASHEKDASI